MADVGWLSRQGGGTPVDRFVDQCQRDGVLGHEIPAECARRDVGDRGDLIHGRSLETLPPAQLDGRVDQGGAGALLLAFTQTEGGLPPYFSHARMLTRKVMN